MSMLREVGRPFEADGIFYETGDIVDVTGWPRVPRLETLRYLRPAPEGSVVTTGSSERGEGGSAVDARIAESVASHLEGPATGEGDDTDGVEQEQSEQTDGEQGEQPEQPETEPEPQPEPEKKPAAEKAAPREAPAKRAPAKKAAAAPRKS